MPHLLLCWWYHLAFFNVIQHLPNPTIIKWFKPIGHLSSNLSLVSNLGRANLVLFNTWKTQFLQISNRPSDNYPLFFYYTQLPLSSILNTLGLSLTENLNWQFLISNLATSASKNLGVLWRLSLRPVPPRCLLCTGALSVHVLSMVLMSWGGRVNSQSLMIYTGNMSYRPVVLRIVAITLSGLRYEFFFFFSRMHKPQHFSLLYISLTPFT